MPRTPPTSRSCFFTSSLSSKQSARLPVSSATSPAARTFFCRLLLLRFSDLLLRLQLGSEKLHSALQQRNCSSSTSTISLLLSHTPPSLPPRSPPLSSRTFRQHSLVIEIGLMHKIVAPAQLERR
eukprot:768105-Hanusia_phi.AAC.1